MTDSIVIGAKHPGPRPKRPPRPRKPRETFKRTEVVWTSEDEDILFADLLHLIPSGTEAQKIRISVERNPLNGYPNVTISYDHEIPNTKFLEQQRDYEERLKQFILEVPEWSQRDEEWQAQRDAHDFEVSKLQSEIERAFDEHAHLLDEKPTG